MAKNDDGNELVSITHPKTGYVNEYSMSKRLKRNLDQKILPSLKVKDKDYVIVVDGKEGSGKSTLAFQIGKYVDPGLDLTRIVFGPEEFREAILKAKKYECIIYDEAFTGFSSRASLSPVNRVLVSLAMQMRQKNLFIIIVLPTIFLLDKYMALFRTSSLIHVHETRGKKGQPSRRGYFKLFNYKKKKVLILKGQKMMSYKHKGLYTRFKGRFYGKFALGDDEMEKIYRKKKEQALANSEKTSMTSAQVRYKEQRDLILYLLRKTSKMTYQELANFLFDYDFDMSFQQISKICAKFGDVIDKKQEKTIKNDKKEEKAVLNDEKEANKPKKDIKPSKINDLEQKTEKIDG